MDVIPPLRDAPFAIDPTMLVSTSVAEPSAGEVVWTSGATFGEGDRAIVAAPASAVTISIGAPAIVTWASNAIPDGTPGVLSTTGALPTGLVAGRVYYVVNRAAGSFQLAAEPDGSPIATSGAQSGTHTFTAHIHRVFESLVASNSGNPPAIDDGAKWIDAGPTNRWAMFDLLRNTQSTGASPLTVVVTPGERVDAIGLVGLVADQVAVEVIRGGVTVYSYSQSLLTRPTVGWYSYFFGTFRQIGAIGLTDLPPYTDAEIHVTLTRATGDVSCGGVVLGRRIYIGDVQYNPEDDAINFSTIDRDTFGNSVLTRRRSVPKTTQTLRARKAMLPAVRRARDDLNAVPALWLGITDPDDGYFESLLILGVYKRWLINLDLPDHFSQQLELEEV